MHRVTLRIPKQQLDAIEAEVDAGRYPNQSEAIRDAIRRLLEEPTGRVDGRGPTIADGGEGR